MLEQLSVLLHNMLHEGLAVAVASFMVSPEPLYAVAWATMDPVMTSWSQFFAPSMCIHARAVAPLVATDSSSHVVEDRWLVLVEFSLIRSNMVLIGWYLGSRCQQCLVENFSYNDCCTECMRGSSAISGPNMMPISCRLQPQLQCFID